MSDLSFSVSDLTEDNVMVKIVKTLEEKTRLVRDQTTLMDVKSEEIIRLKADLQDTEV